MKKKSSKLSYKFTFGFILLTVLICATNCTIGYFKYKSTIEKQYNDHAYQIAAVAQSYVDGDAVERYLNTMETDDYYTEMGEELSKLRVNMNANYIYIAKQDGLDLTYVLDVDNEKDLYEPFILGDKGTVNPEFLEDATKIVTTGERVDNYFYSHSQFGYNTSAIVPVYNSQQKIVGVIGVEISMTLIQTTLMEYIIYAVVVSSLLVVIFIIIYLLYLSRAVIKPINTIAHGASEFVDSNNELSAAVVDIRTGDEIQLLAESLRKMQQDIKNYIENLTAVTAEKERIGAELNVATQIQASMLPCIFPAFPDYKEFDIYATMQPAKEVGGDFYDFFLIDNDHLAVVIADVSGKGVPAALFMVIAKTLIKNQAQAGHCLADVFTMVNAQLCENNEAGMFVTGWMGCFEISTGKFTYVNAGHNHPLIKKADGQYEYLKSRAGFVLAGMEGIKYKQFELQLEPGDMIYLYTDGVTEATDANNELYGEDRLKDVLNKNTDATPDELLFAVKKDIDKFVKEAAQFDDITMLALKIKRRLT